MLELLFGVNYTPIQTKNLQFRKEICLKTQLLSKFIRVFSGNLYNFGAQNPL